MVAYFAADNTLLLLYVRILPYSPILLLIVVDARWNVENEQMDGVEKGGVCQTRPKKAKKKLGEIEHLRMLLSLPNRVSFLLFAPHAYAASNI